MYSKINSVNVNELCTKIMIKRKKEIKGFHFLLLNLTRFINKN